MSASLSFEPERLEVKRLINDNGGLDAAALLLPNQGREVVGKYRDANGHHCEFSVMLEPGLDLAASVREAMQHPTVLE
jgi:hypothetical protein